MFKLFPYTVSEALNSENIYEAALDFENSYVVIIFFRSEFENPGFGTRWRSFILMVLSKKFHYYE